MHLDFSSQSSLAGPSQELWIPADLWSMHKKNRDATDQSGNGRAMNEAAAHESVDNVGGCAERQREFAAGVSLRDWPGPVSCSTAVVSMPYRTPAMLGSVTFLDGEERHCQVKHKPVCIC